MAVPFWGNGATNVLDLDDGRAVRVLCNLNSGACNPYVIETLMKTSAVEVRTHDRLHAKIYGGSSFTIIGSSNASTNGLTVEGETLKGWVEANVLSTDDALVKTALDLFESLWTGSETHGITKLALRAAKSRWDARPNLQPIEHANHGILSLCRTNPTLFRDVYLAVYDSDLGPGAKLALRQLQKEAKGSRPGLSAASFKNAWGYQYESGMKAGMWLIDLDGRKGKAPRVGGTCQVVSPMLQIKVRKEAPLTIAVPGPLRLAGFAKPLKLSRQDKADLIAAADVILKRFSEDDVVPLHKVVRLIGRISS